MEFQPNDGRGEAILRRYEEEQRQRAAERREGRKRGQLSQSLAEKLRACNIPQLHRVKKICAVYLKDQKTPPERQECGERYTVEVLVSLGYRHKRYQLEKRRSTRYAQRVYITGPYAYAYWRDGAFIRKQYYGKSFSKLPRAVRVAFENYLEQNSEAPSRNDALHLGPKLPS